MLLNTYDPAGFVFCTRDGRPHSHSNLRKYLRQLTKRAGLGEDWTTYELRHSFVSLASDQLQGNLRLVADVVGHVDTRTTLGYRHSVRAALPHAAEAWNRLLSGDPADETEEAAAS